MNKNIFSDQEIDRYLEGKMNSQEKLAFESQIDSETDLQDEVQLRRTIIRSIRKKNLTSIIQHEEKAIQKDGKIIHLPIHEQIPAIAANRAPDEIVTTAADQSRQRKSSRRLIISIGSLAMAACFAGVLYFDYSNNQASGLLADRYYTGYPNIYELPSRGGETLKAPVADSLFFDALKLLKQNNSNKAVKQLLDVQTRHSELKAVSGDAVKWYLALAFLKEGKKNKAKGLLQEIVMVPKGEFTEEAKRLLKEI